MPLQSSRILDLPLQNTPSLTCYCIFETLPFYVTTVNSVRYFPLNFSKMPILPSYSSSTLPILSLSPPLPLISQISSHGPWRLHLLPPSPPLGRPPSSHAGAKSDGGCWCASSGYISGHQNGAKIIHHTMKQLNPV